MTRAIAAAETLHRLSESRAATLHRRSAGKRAWRSSTASMPDATASAAAAAAAAAASAAAAAAAAGPKRNAKGQKICCACPTTKQARDMCVVENGQELCLAFIESHKRCLRLEGFDIS